MQPEGSKMKYAEKERKRHPINKKISGKQNGIPTKAAK